MKEEDVKMKDNILDESFEKVKELEYLKTKKQDNYKERTTKLLTLIDSGFIPKPKGWLFSFKCPKCDKELKEEQSPLLNFNNLFSRLDGYYVIQHFYCECGYEYVKPINRND